MIKKGLLFLLCLWVLPGWGAVTFDELSAEEQLGQTLVAFVDVDSAELVRPAIEQGKLGGVLIQWGNYSVRETRRLINKLQEWAAQSPHKIPLLIAIDYEGGTVYTPITLGFEYLPTNMMLAASQDEEKAATLAYLAGLQLRRVGVHVNFSPVLDVNSNPRNPIIGVRSFGGDVSTVTKMGMALMNGFRAAGIVPIVKHFPGHGDTASVPAKHVYQHALLFGNSVCESAVMEPEKPRHFFVLPFVLTAYDQNSQDTAVIAHDRFFLCDRISALPFSPILSDARAVKFFKRGLAGGCISKFQQLRRRPQLCSDIRIAHSTHNYLRFPIVRPQRRCFTSNGKAPAS